MAYTKEKNREYQRKWLANRRAIYFKDKFCVQCGSTKRLELDHIDPSTKVSHSIFSWTEQRRLVELAKCQILCFDCHKIKTISYIKEIDIWKTTRIISPEGMSWCSIGKHFTLITEFGKNSHWPKGIRFECNPCRKLNRKIINL